MMLWTGAPGDRRKVDGVGTFQPSSRWRRRAGIYRFFSSRHGRPSREASNINGSDKCLKVRPGRRLYYLVRVGETPLGLVPCGLAAAAPMPAFAGELHRRARRTRLRRARAASSPYPDLVPAAKLRSTVMLPRRFGRWSAVRGARSRSAIRPDLAAVVFVAVRTNPPPLQRRRRPDWRLPAFWRPRSGHAGASWPSECRSARCGRWSSPIARAPAGTPPRGPDSPHRPRLRAAVCRCAASARLARGPRAATPRYR